MDFPAVINPDRMESTPKTRRESKKTAKEKAGERYSAKHVRQLEELQRRRALHQTKTSSS